MFVKIMENVTCRFHSGTGSILGHDNGKIYGFKLHHIPQ